MLSALILLCALSLFSKVAPHALSIKIELMRTIAKPVRPVRRLAASLEESRRLLEHIKELENKVLTTFFKG
jgi:hypothetical protein